MLVSCSACMWMAPSTCSTMATQSSSGAARSACQGPWSWWWECWGRAQRGSGGPWCHCERAAVALAAVAVSVSGTIGFVGLVAPHITRRLVGPAHEGLVPTAALLGGLLLMFADLIGRWVISPSELPVGIIAAIIGAPYFAYLLYQTRNQ